MDRSIETFIANHLRSAEQLEILLLLERSPDTFWTDEAVAQRLSITRDRSEAALRHLVQHSLVEESRGSAAFRYLRTEHADTIALLAVEYGLRRSEVMNTLFTANLIRLRSFSDAFKIGGRE